MKLELKLNEESKAENPENLPATTPEMREEAHIDIASVLAANQALLKNISLKMEGLETRLAQLETYVRKQTRALKMDKAKTQLLLEPPKQVKAWEPDYPKLDNSYFSRFNIIERWFYPHKLRRKGADN